VPLTYTVVGKR